MTSLVAVRRKGCVLVWSRVFVRNTLGEQEKKDLLEKTCHDHDHDHDDHFQQHQTRNLVQLVNRVVNQTDLLQDG